MNGKGSGEGISSPTPKELPREAGFVQEGRKSDYSRKGGSKAI